jgi:hypothetical protein
MLASSVIYRVFGPRSGQSKDIWKLVFVASTLGTQHYGDIAKTDWLGIEIICRSEVTLCTRGLLFQSTSTIQFQLNMLVYYKASIIIILSNVRFCPP